MNNYSSKTFTYGAEFELADIDRTISLPHNCTFDMKDHTVVNTNGFATDPQAKLCKFGGEINTPGTTESHLYEIASDIFKIPNIGVNYRCNLHIHVRVPGLKDDVEALKKLLQFYYTYNKQIFKHIEPIPKPFITNSTPIADVKGAMKRYKRRHRSHQFVVNEKTYSRLMSSTTSQEFYEAEPPKAPNGRLLWHLIPRSGVNLRQLFEETETVEFRHFPGTLSVKEFQNCVKWCKDYLEIILNNPVEDNTLTMLLNGFKPNDFPKFCDYHHNTEVIYKETSFDHKKRSEIKAYYEKINYYSSHVNPYTIRYQNT